MSAHTITRPQRSTAAPHPTSLPPSPVSPATPVPFAFTPRVSLLPPEVIARAAAARITRTLVRALVGVVIITALAIGVTTVASIVAHVELARAQAETAPLIQQQAAYAEAAALEATVAAVTQARTYGVSTEVNWASYLTQVTASMPAGMTLGTATSLTNAPWESAAAPTGLLRRDRAATFQLTVTAPTDQDITSWVRSLSALPGFADSSVDSITVVDAVHTGTVTLNLTYNARSGRFPAAEPTAPAAN